MKNKYITAGFMAIALLMGGCAKEISSDTYSEAEAGAVKQTYRGTIINARKVKIQSTDKLQDNSLGLIGGGLAGGVLGSTIGKGHGSTIGMVAGAGAGALGGAMAQKALSKQGGIEYVVELTSGRVMTIVQGLTPQLQPGQPVLVMVGSKGRSRIVADQSAGYSNKAVSAVRRKISEGNYDKDDRSSHNQEAHKDRFNQVDSRGKDTYARDYDERSRSPYPREYPAYLN